MPTFKYVKSPKPKRRRGKESPLTPIYERIKKAPIDKWMEIDGLTAEDRHRVQTTVKQYSKRGMYGEGIDIETRTSSDDYSLFTVYVRKYKISSANANGAPSEQE